MTRPPKETPSTHMQPNSATPAHDAPTGERLHKFLARAGVASRRHAEELIVAGAVSVNGRVVRELGTRIDPAQDEVVALGERVQPPHTLLYALLYKPTDVVTTAYDPQRRQTVLDLLPEAWREARVYPVGRLDRDSEGLLLLTNDGDLALRMTHPRYALTKEYHALTVGIPTRATLADLAEGIQLPGETRPTAPAHAWIIRPEGNGAWVGVELHEGRNRQVRRMLGVVGYPVRRLIRTHVGPLTLHGLEPGQSRLLTADEVARLKRAVGLA
ncbi:MAG: pseudouridine synthase [Ktedonobacterales bacterium]